MKCLARKKDGAVKYSNFILYLLQVKGKARERNRCLLNKCRQVMTRHTSTITPAANPVDNFSPSPPLPCPFSYYSTDAECDGKGAKTK